MMNNFQKATDMRINNLKTIGIIYTVFATVSVFLFLIDKISTFQIITGIMFFILYFVGQAFLKLFKKETSWLDFCILWAIAIIFSFQIVFLINDSLKFQSLIITSIFSLVLLLYSLRSKALKELTVFIALLIMTTGLYSSYF